MRHFGFLILSILLLGSCAKDLGNYNYTEQNHVNIAGIEPSYIAYFGQQLKIDPVLTTDDGTNFQANDYTYEWFTLDSSTTAANADKIKKLGNQQNLDIVLTLNPSISNYGLYYRVKNKQTGYVWEKKVALKVTVEISDGWLVLNDINNEARLDMLAYNAKSKTFINYFDIISKTSNLKIVGKPTLIYYLRNSDFINSKSSARIYVSTDKTTYSINNQLYTWDNYRNLKEEVMRPTPTDYRALVFDSYSSRTYMLDSEGILGYEYITQANMYGATLNRLSTGGTIAISPYFASTRQSNNFLVAFDIQKRRLLIHKNSDRSMIIPSSSNPELFQPDDLKKDLIYLAQAPIANSQIYALLKDPVTKKINLIRFTNNNTELVLLGDDAVDSGYGIDQAQFYDVDPTYGYIMYSNNNKIFQYDPFNKVNKLLLDLGNRKLSLMKYQKVSSAGSEGRYTALSKKLMVCSYDEAQPNTSGKMELYNISLSGAPVLAESYTGFGKIVSVSYRE